MAFGVPIFMKFISAAKWQLNFIQVSQEMGELWIEIHLHP
jgi:hypothetical protein